MSDGNLIPISDEQAKLGQEIVGAARDSGKYLTDILGDLPKELVAYLVGDRVKVRREENLRLLWEKSKERLAARGVSDPEPPSLKLALPIIAAAADEDSEALRDLWSRLLAAAMDPNRRDAIRQTFIEAVKQMDPMDALVLKIVRDNGGQTWSPNGRDAVASRLRCSPDEVRVSFDRLAKLDCVWFQDATGAKAAAHLSSFGTLLMNAVSG
jgi:Abortive infection alpha